MQLLLSRSQRTDMGAVVFRLHVRGQMTPAENTAIKKYGFGKTVLYSSHQFVDWGTGLKGLLTRWFYRLFVIRSLAVNELERGKVFDAEDVTHLVDIEERILESARNLKEVVKIASGYQGEQVVDI